PQPEQRLPTEADPVGGAEPRSVSAAAAAGQGRGAGGVVAVGLVQVVRQGRLGGEGGGRQAGRGRGQPLVLETQLGEVPPLRGPCGPEQASVESGQPLAQVLFRGAIPGPFPGGVTPTLAVLTGAVAGRQVAQGVGEAPLGADRPADRAGDLVV